MLHMYNPQPPGDPLLYTYIYIGVSRRRQRDFGFKYKELFREGS
jgi:hypothetical protein